MESAHSAPVTIAFLDLELLPAQRLLLRDGAPLTIGARAFDLLAMLATHPCQVLSHRALIARVWPDTVVIEANLRVQVAALRKLLGVDGAAIVNVAGRGYCFTARVSTRGASPSRLRRDPRGRPRAPRAPSTTRHPPSLAGA